MSTPARTEQSAAPVEPAADHALLHGMDPQDLGTEVAGAVIGAQLATVDVDARGQTLLHLQAIDEGVMDALGGAKEAGVGVTLDPSAWPIVHGSPESQDRTGWRQPRGDPKRRFMLFSSQSVHEDEEANALYMGHLLVRILY